MKIVQRLNVGGDMIVIKAKQWTHCRNFQGWIFDINGHTYKVSEINFDNAKDYAFSKFIKENR